MPSADSSVLEVGGEHLRILGSGGHTHPPPEPRKGTLLTSRARSVHTLSTTVGPLVSAYDMIMFDLDGVLYVGAEQVPYAADSVHKVRGTGASVAFVTNNASRTPERVAAHLRDVGIPAVDTDVVTSAQAAARLVAELVPPGAAVLVVGGAGLESALAECGLRAVRALTEKPAAVLQGYSPDVAWTHLAEASYAVAAGLPWVASNTDLTIPTARGIAPGNGTLVAAVAAASGGRPRVAGKPEAPLFDETVLRVGGRRPLVVGDRLDTDIEGANRVGADSLLVLTGVTTAGSVCNAAPERRPTFVAPDLRGLSRPQPDAEVYGDGSRQSCGCGGWRAEVDPAGVLTVSPESNEGPGVTDDRRIALLRAAVGAVWAWRDGQTSPPEIDASALTVALAEA
jgi:HAD superfamily hydrolase (TIGR01450 family)